MQTFPAAARLLRVLGTALLVTFAVFALTTLLRDPTVAILGEQADRAQVAELRRELGLDRPVVLQYGDWLAGVLRGDLGRSLGAKQPVFDLLLERIGPTLQLTFAAIFIAAALGVPLGVLSALWRGRWVESVVNLGSLVGVAVPNFLVGLLMVVVFSLLLGWLPPSGYVSIFDDFAAGATMLLMPAFALSLEILSVVVRLTRSTVVDTLSAPYVVAARARGVPEWKVIGKYALRIALVPVTVFIGLRVGRLFGGAVVVESVFGIPGIGKTAVHAMLTADFPIVAGVVLLVAIAVGVSNLFVDAVHAVIDPRVR